MLEPHSGHDDITDVKTWAKFLPDFEAQAKERLSPEIPVICPMPVKGNHPLLLMPACQIFIMN